MTPPSPLSDLTDQALLAETVRLADRERAATAGAPPMVKPLASERYQVRFTMTREAHDKLRRAQDLLRHVIPDGDPATIFDRALTLLLADIERKKLAAAVRSRSERITETRSRHIPASVKRAVWTRDGGRCAFSGAHGRCEERGFLEFHHAKPYAAGGAAVVENLELRCRSHNAYEAELFFGMPHPPMARETGCLYSCDGATRSGPDRVDGRGGEQHNFLLISSSPANAPLGRDSRPRQSLRNVTSGAARAACRASRRAAARERKRGAISTAHG